MTIGQLRTFLAVVRNGSVRGAAAALFVSEPSVSAAVAALERELKADLFERHGRGVRLTTAGEAFARYVADALGMLEQGIDAARDAARPGTGRLRLVSVTTAGEYIVPRLLREFRAREPEVEPILEVGNRAFALDRLVAREADLGIGGRPPQGRGLAGVRILPNHLILVAAPAHPLVGRSAVAVADLSGETWLMREQGSGTSAATEEFLAGAGIQPRARLMLGSNGAVKQAAAVGLGITLLSRDAVALEIDAGILAEVSVKGLPLRRHWYALYLERGALPPAAERFLKFLRTRAAEPGNERSRPARRRRSPG